MLLRAGPTHEGQEGLVGASAGMICMLTARVPFPLPLPGVLKKRPGNQTHSSSGWSLTLHPKCPFPNVPSVPSWGPKLAPALPLFALIRAGCSSICAEVGRATPAHATSGSDPRLPFKHERNLSNSAFLHNHEPLIPQEQLHLCQGKARPSPAEDGGHQPCHAGAWLHGSAPSSGLISCPNQEHRCSR